MSKITYSVTENTCNDINTLSLIANHPLRNQLIARRVHNRKLGSVNCTDKNDKHVPVESFSKTVLDTVNEFESQIFDLEESNIAANLVGREIFAAFETK